MSAVRRVAAGASLLAASLTLWGCGSSSSSPSSGGGGGKVGSCGTSGGGTQTCVNNPRYTCSNCGYRPCVSSSGSCYSCYGVDGNCYSYDCGTHCSSTPCGSSYSTCGTSGYGDQHCVNNPQYTCYNCGPAPCVDNTGTCYSCYSAQTGYCYTYYCASTRTCSSSSCFVAGAEHFPASSFTVAAAEAGAGGVPAHWVPKFGAADGNLTVALAAAAPASAPAMANTGVDKALAKEAAPTIAPTAKLAEESARARQQALVEEEVVA